MLTFLLAIVLGLSMASPDSPEHHHGSQHHHGTHQHLGERHHGDENETGGRVEGEKLTAAEELFDRAVEVAGDGQEELALDMMEELVQREYVPAMVWVGQAYLVSGARKMSNSQGGFE